MWFSSGMLLLGFGCGSLWTLRPLREVVAVLPKVRLVQIALRSGLTWTLLSVSPTVWSSTMCLQTASFGLPQCCAGSGRVCDFKFIRWRAHRWGAVGLYLSLQEIGWCRVSGDSLLFANSLLSVLPGLLWFFTSWRSPTVGLAFKSVIACIFCCQTHAGVWSRHWSAQQNKVA